MTAIKRKFVCVEPVSSIARIRFDIDMDGLHSCYVDEENGNTLLLTSINQKYKFSMNKKEDANWVIVK